MDHFVFGGISSMNFGLRIEKPRIAKKPKPRITKVTVPGGNKDFIYREEGFDNVDVTYQTWCLERERELVLSRLGEISQWLSGGEYLTLSDSYDPDYFRLGYCREPLDPDILLRCAAKQDIVFSCDPFRYFWDGENMVPFYYQTNTGFSREFVNTGWPSMPLLEVVGTGKFTVKVETERGNKKESWKADFEISGTMLVDSYEMETTENGNPANHKKTGAGYPTLGTGNVSVNVKSTQGVLQTVSIKPRWRTI